jgi:enoyl-CoA hydratase/carnithine racemase
VSATAPLYALHDAARERGIPRYRLMSRDELAAALAEPARPPRPRTEVDVDVSGPLAVLTLRGQTRENTLALETLEELAERVEDAAGQADVRLVAITGTGGRIFSAGADLESLEGLRGVDIARRGGLACERIARAGVATVAVLNGHCVGGALDLALACDWRVAAPAARLRFIHNELGYSPPWGGARRLAMLMPAGAALRMFALCQTLTAREARTAGIVDDVVESKELHEHVRGLAARASHAGREAVAVTKRLLRERPAPRVHEAAFARLWDAASLGTSAREE